VQGERRQVTFLFADITGSTAIAHDLDPEEVAAIMGQAQDCLIGPVQRFGGTLAQIMGDGVLAFFGAPVAHEDDAERAVLAGLAIQESARRLARELLQAQGIDFAVRVGINTGVVVVGEIGSGLHMEYRAMGDAVNLAQRVESVAAPGSVLISASTYRLVKALFEVSPQEPVVVKGVSEPLLLYQVLHPVKSDDQASATWTAEVPLVGRGRELRTLQSCMQRLQAGDGQLICLAGETGMGKSRLIAELRRQATTWFAGEVTIDQPAISTSASLAWIQVRCLSYWQSLSYGPLIDFVRQWAHILPPDDQATAQAKLQRQLQELGALQLLPYLASLLGLPLSPDQAERVRHLTPERLRQRFHVSLVELVRLLSHRRPLVIVVDDLEWADPDSLALLDALIPALRADPVMLILVHRSESDDGQRGLVDKALRLMPSRCTQLTLEAISEKDSIRLLGYLLDSDDLEHDIALAITTKAGGNPLFLAEIARSFLTEAGVPEVPASWDPTAITVPDTLRGVIMARLDRLGETTRHLLQLASVIGRTFSGLLLSCVTHNSQSIASTPLYRSELQQALDSLERAQLIIRESTDQYTFRNALTHEVAYRSLLRAQRRDLHGSVAACMEEQFAPLPVQMHGVLAQHYRLGGQAERALHHLVLAGEQARRTYANQEARSIFTDVLQLVGERLDARAGTALLGLGELDEIEGNYEKASAAYHSAHQLWKQLEQPAEMAEANFRLGQLSARLGHLERAQHYYQIGLDQIAGQQDTDPLRAWGHLCLASAQLRIRPNDRQAREHLQQALSISQALDDPEGLARCYGVLAHDQSHHGQLSEAIGYAKRTIEAAQQASRLEWAATWHNNIAYWLLLVGRCQDAMAHLIDGLALAERIGDVIAEAYLHTTRADCHLFRGDLEEAQRASERAAKLGLLAGRDDLCALTAIQQGALAIQTGDHSNALAAFQRAVDLAERCVPELLALSRHHLAKTYLACNDPAAAETQISQGLEHARGRWEFRHQALLIRDRAVVNCQRGQWQQSWEAFAESVRLLKKVGDPIELARGCCVWGAAHLVRDVPGDRERARQLINQALDTFTSSGSNPDTAQAQALLTSQSPLRPTAVGVLNASW
jgi:class 3 adenylate cyclase/tetratricopeptide (TPR) repeat protein